MAQACLYALLAYNTCLGQAITEAEEAREDKAAEAAQHEQVAMGRAAHSLQYMAALNRCWLCRGPAAAAVQQRRCKSSERCSAALLSDFAPAAPAGVQAAV